MSNNPQSTTGGTESPPTGEPAKSDKQSDKPLKRRLLSDTALRSSLKELSIRDPIVPIARAVGVHFTTALAILAVAILFNYSLPLAAAAAACAAVPIGRGYRGLECLVHGASHYDIFEIRRGRANDMVADALMAFPSFQTTAAFRELHFVHHARFGGDGDPCMIRMQANDNVKAGLLPSLMSTLKRLPQEMLGFYRLVGAKPVSFATGLAWHFAVLVAPVAALFGWTAAAAAWAMTMLPVFTLALPVIRALGEAGEHDYAAANDNLPQSDTLRRTFNNIGPLNAFLHPFGDALHIEHHEFPATPQYKLHRLHALLLQMPEYMNIARRRDGVLDAPMLYPDAANDNEPLRSP
jgi:fatty acid desaturase